MANSTTKILSKLGRNTQKSDELDTITANLAADIAQDLPKTKPKNLLDLLKNCFPEKNQDLTPGSSA